VQKAKRFLVAFLATAGGAGFAPKAPGTMGTLMAVPLVLLTRDWSPWALLALFLALFFAGWWATLEWSRNTGEPDSQKIVIDEVLGFLLAMGTFPGDFSILFIQFVSFRLLDALKPPPIRQLDRYGKRFAIGPMQSFGVIADDLLAGLLSWAILALILRFFPLSTWPGLSG
jgi:phosphatidylglycerophosphatase A